MSRNITAIIVFAVGLLALCWIGAGYATTNPLAFFVTAVIAACYVSGAWELLRFRRASLSLHKAVAALDAPPEDLPRWLGTLPVEVRNAVRLRIEGERVPLPGPSLSAYLIGLLVLLGMLGTLLGMMVTLRGTGLALESATDLDAIRSSLAAPVKGLAFAFGTSIVGVTCSAMLGLLSALFRGERVEVVQQLDTAIAGQLSSFSKHHQQRQTFRLLQEQNALMPTLVERLQAMVTSIEQQQVRTGEQLLGNQQAFHARSETHHAQLATSLQQAMHSGIEQSGNVLNATLQPLLEATLQGLGEQARQLHQNIHHAVQQQVDSVTHGLRDAQQNMAENWRTALLEQQQGNQSLQQELQHSLQQFVSTFELQASQLVNTVAAHQTQAAAANVSAWKDARAQQDTLQNQLLQQHAQALSEASSAFDGRATALQEPWLTHWPSCTRPWKPVIRRVLPSGAGPLIQ